MRILIYPLIASAIFLSSCTSQSSNQYNSASDQSTFATVFVNFDSYKLTFDSIDVKSEKTLFQVLDSLKDHGQIQLADTAYGSLGHLILGFDGILNDAPKYWVYCLNGQKANKGVDLLVLEAGDQIDWYYTSESNACSDN